MDPTQVINLLLLGIEEGAPRVLALIDSFKKRGSVTYEEVLESIEKEPPPYTGEEPEDDIVNHDGEMD